MLRGRRFEARLFGAGCSGACSSDAVFHPLIFSPILNTLKLHMLANIFAAMLAKSVKYLATKLGNFSMATVYKLLVFFGHIGQQYVLMAIIKVNMLAKAF